VLSRFWREALDPIVAVDAVESIKLLALVLVDALHLNVKQGSRCDSDSTRLLNDIAQSHLVLGLDGAPFSLKLLVINDRAKRRDEI